MSIFEGDDEILKYRRSGAASHVRRPERTIPAALKHHDVYGRSVIGRVRAASNTPESVVKVISYGGDRKAVKQMIDYITRKSELALETKDGLLLTTQDGPDGTDELIADWSQNFRSRAKARNAMHLAVSAPPGSDPGKVLAAARVFAERAFGEGYDYGFAPHTDESHPHVHIVVVRDSAASPNLGWNKKEAQAFRDLFAEAATEQGLAMNATPRLMRGVAERGEKIAVRKVREREGTSRCDVRAAAEVLDELAKGQGGERPWVSAMAARAQEERAQYEALATDLELLADELGDDETGIIRSTGRMVRRQSMALRQLLTRRDQMRRIAERDRLDRRQDQERAARELAKAYRDERQQAKVREKAIAPASGSAVTEKLAQFNAALGQRLDQLAGQGNARAEQMRQVLDDVEMRDRDREL